MPQYWDAEGKSYGDNASGTGRFGRIGYAGVPPPEYSHYRQKERQQLDDPYFPIFLVCVTIVDIALFIWEMVKNKGFEPFSVNPMGGPSAQTLVDCGAKYAPCIVDDGQWWRFISPMFLHAGILHIVVNMYTQVRVGFELERCYGALRIAPVYLGAGVMGNLLSAIFLPNIPSVGASSCLMGLVALMLIDIIIHWDSLKNPGLALCEYFCQLIIILLIGLLPVVDNFAHIGGYAGGMMIAIVFIPGVRRAIPKSEESCGKCTIKFLGMVVFAAATVVAYIIMFSIFYSQVPPYGWCYNCQLIDCLPILDWCTLPDIPYSCS